MTRDWPGGLVELWDVKVICKLHDRIQVAERFTQVRTTDGGILWLPNSRRSTWRETTNPGGIMGETLRVRIRIECDICKKPVVVQKPKLNPILDTLAEHREPSITWQQLDARLRRSGSRRSP
jgi:hypothetical protein